MNKHKKVMMGLAFALLAMVFNAREWIWDIIQPWPAWWKLLIAFGFSLFITMAIIFSFGFEGYLFELFGLSLP